MGGWSAQLIILFLLNLLPHPLNRLLYSSKGQFLASRHMCKISIVKHKLGVELSDILTKLLTRIVTNRIAGVCRSPLRQNQLFQPEKTTH